MNSTFPMTNAAAAMSADTTTRATNTATPNLPAFVWAVADLLRGDFKQSE